VVAARTPLRLRRGATRAELVLLGALALLVVAAAATSLVLAPRVSAAQARADRDQAILHAARQEAVDFTTLDYRSLDRDLGRVLAGSTGSFKTEFQTGTKDLRTVVTTNKTVSTGSVLSAGIVSADPDSARVLVVADATVTNTKDPKGTPRHYRLQLDLVRQGGTWLTSDLQFVG
jgi:Mce-associated membrane protein